MIVTHLLSTSCRTQLISVFLWESQALEYFLHIKSIIFATNFKPKFHELPADSYNTMHVLRIYNSAAVTVREFILVHPWQEPVCPCLFHFPLLSMGSADRSRLDTSLKVKSLFLFLRFMPGRIGSAGHLTICCSHIWQQYLPRCDKILWGFSTKAWCNKTWRFCLSCLGVFRCDSILKKFNKFFNSGLHETLHGWMRTIQPHSIDNEKVKA